MRRAKQASANPQMDSAPEETVGEDDIDQNEQARKRSKFKIVSNPIRE